MSRNVIKAEKSKLSEVEIFRRLTERMTSTKALNSPASSQKPSQGKATPPRRIKPMNLFSAITSPSPAKPTSSEAILKDHGLGEKEMNSMDLSPSQRKLFEERMVSTKLLSPPPNMIVTAKETPPRRIKPLRLFTSPSPKKSTPSVGVANANGGHLSSAPGSDTVQNTPSKKGVTFYPKHRAFTIRTPQKLRQAPTKPGAIPISPYNQSPLKGILKSPLRSPAHFNMLLDHTAASQDDSTTNGFSTRSRRISFGPSTPSKDETVSTRKPKPPPLSFADALGTADLVMSPTKQKKPFNYLDEGGPGKIPQSPLAKKSPPSPNQSRGFAFSNQKKSPPTSPSVRKSPPVSPSGKKSPPILPCGKKSPPISPSGKKSPPISQSRNKSPPKSDPILSSSKKSPPCNKMSPPVSPSSKKSPSVSPNHKKIPSVSPTTSMPSLPIHQKKTSPLSANHTSASMSSHKKSSPLTNQKELMPIKNSSSEVKVMRKIFTCLIDEASSSQQTGFESEKLNFNLEQPFARFRSVGDCESVGGQSSEPMALPLSPGKELGKGKGKGKKRKQSWNVNDCSVSGTTPSKMTSSPDKCLSLTVTSSVNESDAQESTPQRKVVRKRTRRSKSRSGSDVSMDDCSTVDSEQHTHSTPNRRLRTATRKGSSGKKTRTQNMGESSNSEHLNMTNALAKLGTKRKASPEQIENVSDFEIMKMFDEPNSKRRRLGINVSADSSSTDYFSTAEIFPTSAQELPSIPNSKCENFARLGSNSNDFDTSQSHILRRLRSQISGASDSNSNSDFELIESCGTESQGFTSGTESGPVLRNKPLTRIQSSEFGFSDESESSTPSSPILGPKPDSPILVGKPLSGLKACSAADRAISPVPLGLMTSPTNTQLRISPGQRKYSPNVTARGLCELINSPLHYEHISPSSHAALSSNSGRKHTAPQSPLSTAHNTNRPQSPLVTTQQSILTSDNTSVPNHYMASEDPQQVQRPKPRTRRSLYRTETKSNI